jgi:signal transduction histidine kinase
MIAIGVLFMTAFALAFVLFFNFSQRKLVTQKLDQQEALLHRVIETQEFERQRIAKDLHDEIGSQLNIINLNLHRLKRKQENPEIVKETIDDIQGLLAATIRTTRQISHDLLPSTLDSFGLIAAIEELSEHYSKTNFELQFNIQENESTIEDQSVELNIFRVLQELISNATRHGGATLVSIQFWLNDEHLKLIIQDNGKGFDTHSPEFKAGLGLSNIESRMKMSNGKVNIRSILNQGTTIKLLVKKG